MSKTMILAVAAALTLSTGALANRPVSDAPQGTSTTIQSGTMTLETVNGCYVLIRGTVTTFPVGGIVAAGINVWDDGIYLQGIALHFPGDGGTHPYLASYQQQDPVLQGATGVGFYLQEAASATATEFFATNGSYNDLSDVCTGPAPDISGFDATAVPTLGQIGLAVLVGLLALAAVAVMMRRRSAPHA